MVDQERLAAAKVVVVGAGAIGNETLKNLALLGVGNVLVIDMDTIEASNLSRSVLFRGDDVGGLKAEVAAARTREIYPGCRAVPLVANIVHEVGLGIFHWADIVLGALDNREARLWINRACWKLNRPWIDGAIEGINGVVRVFLPGQPPCYECTLGEVDWRILDRRMSCKLLTREQMASGKTPTTPTTSSVIAGVQVQEALKQLHGLPVLAGKGYVFEGMHHTSYVVEYTPNPDCFSHETYGDLRTWPKTSEETSLAELMAWAREALDTDAVVLDFSRELIASLHCPKCGEVTEVFACVGSMTEDQARCPHDDTVRNVTVLHGYKGEDGLGSRTLASLGLPPYDVVTARSMEREVQMLIEGDARTVLAGFERP